MATKPKRKAKRRSPTAPRIIRSGTNLRAALARAAEQSPSYCRNCGDPFDADAENAALRQPSGAWRPCPKPSPGRPMVDCGVGGHMYDERQPRCN